MTGSTIRRPILLGGLLLATGLLVGPSATRPAATQEAQALWGGDAQALHCGGVTAKGAAAPANLERRARAGQVG